MDAGTAASLVAAVALVVAAPAVCRADSGDESTWSIGVGVGQQSSSYVARPAAMPIGGFATYSLSGVVSFPAASAAFTSGAAPQFGLSLQVERRIGQANWLVAGVRGHHSRESGTSPMLEHRMYADTVDWLSAQTEYGAALGLRHVVNPGDFVEIGGLLAFDVVFANLAERETLAGYDDELNAMSSRVYETEGSGWYAGARVGLTAEVALMRSLALRLTVSVLNAGWVGSTTTVTAEGGSKDEVKASEFRTGVQLMPLIELRLAL